MKIQFAEIPDHGLVLEIKDQSWFPEEEITKTGPVWARLRLQPKGRDRILLTGEITMPLQLECDRCLTNFNAEIDGRFTVDLELVAGEAQVPVDHACSAEEMDALYLLKPEIDVFDVLTQQVFLLAPSKKVCSEKCRGLCPRCGANLNSGLCRCKPEESTSPFSVLSGLKR
jgi:uncharacterized protein